MRCHQPAGCSSSDDSDESDNESYFDTEDEESDPDTNPTDVDTDVEDTDVEGDGEADAPWFLDEDKDHPPEYCHDQEDEFDKSEFMDEDYSDNSILLLDYIEERWHQ